VPANQYQFVKERPCARCVKRNIGHLCHDEPREPAKRARSDQEHSAADEEGSSNNELGNVQSMPRNVDVPDAAGQQILPDGTIGIQPSSVQPANISSSGQGLDTNPQQCKPQDEHFGALADVEYYSDALQRLDGRTKPVSGYALASSFIHV